MGPEGLFPNLVELMFTRWLNQVQSGQDEGCSWLLRVGIVSAAKPETV